MLMGKPKVNLLVGCCESTVVQSIAVLLKDSCQVTARAHFDEFVRVACAGEFDLVIVYGNCITPPYVSEGGLLANTLATTKTIRAASPVPILVLTSTPEWRGALLEAGADSCVPTPFNLTTFRQAVDGCLQRRT